MPIDPNSEPPAYTWEALQAMLAFEAFADCPECTDWLEAQGCEIEYQPGYCPKLLRSSPSVWGDYLRWALRDDPPIVQVFQQTASTQDAARRLAEAEGDKAHRAVVIAVEQTAGRGRLGRSWQAPPGTGVTFSLVHLYNHHNRQATLDRMVAASSVGTAMGMEAVVDDLDFTAEFKWPNDLMTYGRKFGGILVETHKLSADKSAAIIGVGINVSLQPDHLRETHPDLADQITSLAHLDWGHIDRLAVLTAAVKGIYHGLYHMPRSKLIGTWRGRNVMLSQRIHFRSGGQDIIGSVVDLDLQEGLVVRTETGSIVHLPAATTTVVSWRKPSL